MATDSSGAFMQIFPASAATIRSRSHGEVENPETIHYRSLKPEKGGLFCERIFGPVRDWECSCGKYKRAKHQGVVCDRCGVEVTLSKVRRERMGHIELAVPCVHPWFLHRNKIISDLLGIDYQDLVNVVYFEAYLIIEIENWRYDHDFYSGKVISEEEYFIAERRYGSRLTAKMGAEAVLALLKRLDLKEELKSAQDLVRELGGNGIRGVPDKAKSLARIERRIDAVKYFLDNDVDPADMVLTVLPVMPPDLRPLVALADGRFATSDLNDLYRRVINRSNRLKNLFQFPISEAIIRNEKRMLQEAVDALFDNGLYGRTANGYGYRPLESLTHHLETNWKVGKTVDYSASTAAVPDPDLPDDTVSVPREIAKVLLEPFLVAELTRRNFAHTARGAKKIIDGDGPNVFSILGSLVPDLTVFVTHPPVVNDLRARFFRIRLTDDPALHLSQNSFYDMEFDKPSTQAKIFLPLSREAQYEARYLAAHPLRRKKRNADARIVLKMLEYDAGNEPLPCPSCEYAGTLNELGHVPIGTHIQLPGKIHTSIGGALLALEIPDILSREKYPSTVEDAEKILADTVSTPRLRQLLSKYSHLADSGEETRESEIYRDDCPATYDRELIDLQKTKFEGSLPVKELNLESVYVSAFADLAYCTYCRNKLYHECSVEDCPAHGLSGKERCLCSDKNGNFPCQGSAIGLAAVYELIEFFAETGSKTAVQMIYQHLLRTGDVIPDSAEELENRFHFPRGFPVREFELLLAIRKQQGNRRRTDFFCCAAKNAPDTILDAIFEGRKISLTSPNAIPCSGEKPETCAAEIAIKKESSTNALSASEWIDLMAAFPEMGQYCAWGKFEREDFLALFRKLPTQLGHVSIAYSSGELHISDWIDIFAGGIPFSDSQMKQIFTPEEFELISKGVGPRDILSDDIGRSPLSDDTAEESDAEDDLLDIGDDLD